MDAQSLYDIGVALAVAGTLIVTVAAALILASRKGKTGRARIGGAIIIGPIPIVFGADKESLKTILLLSTILTALLIALIVLLHFLH